MNIYLIRHAEAEQTSEGKPHEERALTTNGIEIIKSSIELWKKFIDNFDIILTSPLKRAKQTANILHSYFKSEFDVVEEIILLNGGLTEDLLSVARSLNLNEIAMVGHQPDLGIHVARMIGTIDSNFIISPAAIAKIHFKERPEIGKGILEFLLPPIIKKG
jgi:phosphohistidine phosphatase